MEEKEQLDGMRLNKYIAHCGISNRREANAIIKGGLVKINNEVIKNPATRVLADDIVAYRDHPVKPLEPKVYVLMNKPKNVSIDVKDNVRKSVLDIVQPKYPQTLTPISQLGNMDLGLLLLSNDDALIEKFNQTNAEFTRIYHLVLDKELSTDDRISIKELKVVNEKPIQIEDLDFIKYDNKLEVGIEISIGNATQLHSLFQALGYSVEKLDCMNYANLTKKDLPRGWFRDLGHKEIVLLRHFV